MYDPNEVDEAEGKSLLKHYDETIDGKKRKRFTLAGQGTFAEERDAKKHLVGEKLRAQPISLDIIKDVLVSDYNDVSDTKIRKPKKKAKSTRQKPDEDGLFPAGATIALPPDGNVMDIDSSLAPKAVTQTPHLENMSFVDDDDLQASLAFQRRAALKSRKKTKPEDIARHIREEAATPDLDGHHGHGQDEGCLVIDETSEFVANLERSTEADKPRAGSVKQSKPTSKRSATPDDEMPDVDMDQSHNNLKDDDDLQPSLKRENPPTNPGLTVTGLEEESTLSRGIGATLSMLSQRGLIKLTSDGDINELHRKRQNFLAEKQRREAEAERKARLQRERDRASGKLDRMSARDREEYARWENKQRDQQESRQMLDIFNREYKPDVQLKYVDEFGRSMDQKEAFKHLSHQFHGKGSGKQKTEKHLKKIENDKKREAMSSLDSSQATGMNNAMGATAKKNRQAGVRMA